MVVYFSDDDDEVLDQALLTLLGTPKQTIDADTHRFLVLEIHHLEFESVLSLFNEERNNECLCYVREDWTECLINTGDFINIIGKAEFDGNFVVDNSKNVLVVHPDRLVTGTRVGSSLTCMRRAVLSEKINFGSMSIHAQKGILAHELFQRCLKASNFGFKFIAETAKRIVQKSYTSLLSFQESEEDFIDYLTSLVPQLQSWAALYVGHKGAGEVMFSGQTYSMHITDVIDIEDMIWAPKFGLQGKIDATIRVNRSVKNGNASDVGIILPLELKTGRPYITDNAQLALYTLLVKTRYADETVSGQGALMYITPQSVAMHGVNNGQNELRSLLIKRNIIAAYLTESEIHGHTDFLPDVTSDERQCQKCFQIGACSLYRKAYSNGKGDYLPVDERTSHVPDVAIPFFDFWNRMIDLEAREARQLQTGIWNESSASRQLHGRCIGNVCIKDKKIIDDRYIYRFEINSAERNIFLTNLSFEKGDKVIISTESGQAAIAIGFLSEIYSQSVSVCIFGKPIATRFEQSIFRLDKDEFMGAPSKLRGALVSLFEADTKVQRMRRLIIELKQPEFDVDWDPSQMNNSLRELFNSLNDDQRYAICRIMAAKDYTLVLGMPGTGKSTLIVFLIRLLISFGLSVLIVCHTNTSLDNILEKLDDVGVSFTRWGSSSEKIPARLRKYLFNEHKFKNLKDAREFCKQEKVVGSTCLGVTPIMMGGKQFDMVIADESSQATQAVMLLPLQMGQRFVLVGDHYQLPPLIKDPIAKQAGMDISLFLRLSEVHPQSVCQLSYQYRMNAPILRLCNEMIYSNALKCGSAAVADNRLPCFDSCRFPKMRRDFKHLAHMDWIRAALNPNPAVLFFSTDQMAAFDTLRGEQNHHEAKLVFDLVYAFIEAGMKPSEIGVVIPYRSQIRLIRNMLPSSLIQQLEIESVDKFQGRDKNCIIMSFVRSNEQGRVGELLQDWRRINVAVSRAKQKLIFIGSMSTLKHSPIMKALLDIVRRENWVFHLPHNALTIYEHQQLMDIVETSDEGSNMAFSATKRSKTENPAANNLSNIALVNGLT